MGTPLLYYFLCFCPCSKIFIIEEWKNNQQPKLLTILQAWSRIPRFWQERWAEWFFPAPWLGEQKHKGSGAALPPPTLSFFLYLHQRRVHFQPSASPRTMQLRFRAPKAFPRQLVGSRVNGLMNKENTHELWGLTWTPSLGVHTCSSLTRMRAHLGTPESLCIECVISLSRGYLSSLQASIPLLITV